MQEILARDVLPVRGRRRSRDVRDGLPVPVRKAGSRRQRSIAADARREETIFPGQCGARVQALICPQLPAAKTDTPRTPVPVLPVHQRFDFIRGFTVAAWRDALELGSR